MSILPDYTTGTITLTSGSKDFTTSGSALQSKQVRSGDMIYSPVTGLFLLIDTITGENSGTLAYNCPAAAAVTDGPLRVRFQPDVSRYTAALYDVLDKLKSGNVDALAGLIGSAGKIPQFTGAGTMQLADYLVFNFRDDWATAQDYVVNDVVRQGGNTYLCLIAHTSGTFATDLAAGKWGLFVPKGDQGIQGVKGDKGDQGIQGPQGTAGNFTGPASATDGNLIVFDGPTGGKGKDSGKKPADFQINLNPTTLFNRLPYFDGAGAAALTALSAFARTMLDDADGATAFATMGATQSLSANGYQKLPSGLIIQWGTQQPVPAASDYNVTFPLAFPTACFSVVIGGFSGSTTELNMVGGVPTKTGFSVRSRTYTNGSGTGWIFWFATGN